MRRVVLKSPVLENCTPGSVRGAPGNRRPYLAILFVPGAFLMPQHGIWWGVDEIKTFKGQGFVGLKLWPHGAILSAEFP